MEAAAARQDKAPEPALTIADIPYEILVLLTSWLSVFDVMFGLRPTNKLFYEISHDPVTWTRILVDDYNDKVLGRILSLYGNYITSVVCGSPSAVSVFQGCRNLAHAFITTQYTEEDIELPDELPPRSLRSLHVDVLDKFLSPCVSNLRSLNARTITIPTDMLAGLVDLSFGDFFATFGPEALPNLRALRCGGVVGSSEWNAFVVSHPSLTDLCLTDFSFTAEIPTGCMYPDKLQRFQYQKLNNAAPLFLQMILRSNTELRRLEIASELPDATFVPIIAELTKLTSLHMYFGGTVTADDVNPLKVLPLVDCSLFGRKENLIAATGVASRHLRISSANTELHEDNGSALQYVRSVSVSNTSTLTHGGILRLIGENCRRLHSIDLQYVEISDEVVDLFSAHESLRTIELYYCKGALSSVGAALSHVHALRELYVVTRSPGPANEFLSSFVQGLDHGFHMEFLKFSRGDAETLSHLENATAAGLRVVAGNIVVEGDTAELQSRWDTVVRKLSLWSPQALEFRIANPGFV